MDMVRAFLADDGGDTTTGVALGALLVLVVVLLIFVMGGFGQPQQDQPGIDINIRQRT